MTEPTTSIPTPMSSDRLTRLESAVATLASDVASIVTSVKELAKENIETRSRIDTIGKPRWGALIGTAVGVMMFVLTMVGGAAGVIYTLLLVPMQQQIDANTTGRVEFPAIITEAIAEAVRNFDTMIQREMDLKDERLAEATRGLHDYTDLRADQNFDEIMRVRDWLWTIAVEDRNALRELRDRFIFGDDPTPKESQQ